MPTTPTIRHRRLIVIALLLMAVPLLVTVISFAARSEQETWLEPARAGTSCVFPKGNQRYDHMRELKRMRDHVLRDGNRAGVAKSVGLSSCHNCHEHREQFCDKCHTRASVSLDCFGCHSY